jgi:hypothetical protein
MKELMRPCVLFRKGCNSHKEDEAEISAAESAWFTVLDGRTKIKENDFVVPRYSAYPFVKELFDDIHYNKAVSINTYEQFDYIADLKNWVVDLKDMTPETWGDITKIPDDGPFILKGETNSRKGDWKTMMFAADKTEAIKVHNLLSKDGLIGQQHIYIRKFEEFVKFGDSIVGMPIANEFRFFIYDGKVLSGGFYWVNSWESNDPMPSPDCVDRDFLQAAVDIVSKKSRAFVMDVAEKKSGGWTVVELNAFESSGLSDNDPAVLYSNLYNTIKGNK